MNLWIRVALVLAAATAVGACTTSAGTGSTDPCAADHPHPRPDLSCSDAVAAATAALGLQWPTTSVRFQRGALCPPNARCGRSEDDGVVVYRFMFGGPLLVQVGLSEAGQIVAQLAIPPPDWFQLD